MTMKLYGLAMSTCTSKVITCLHEHGAEFELVPVNLQNGEHKQPAFLAKNPFGQIPALDDGDLTLFESRAISTYVAEKFKGSGCDLLRSQNPKEAALVKAWMEVESQQFSPAISSIFYQFIIVPSMYGGSPNQMIIDESSAKLGKVLDVYEKRLSSSKYLAGDFYNLADLHHLSYIYYLMKTPYGKLINERPRVRAWWEDISSRPAFKKVAAGLTLGDKN
ncbi:glutathione S-transferase F13-like [Hibiscus syriacus]|uniref:glutathione S-transferase F13-like n=1 Tax=Hibiscus syriacus TaxID=106335 RepID=UPI001924A757|nr:glutathione S-transferase F13-like [Hibiscus syriacus]